MCTRESKNSCAHLIAIGEAERDITADLRGALIPANPNRYPTITDPKQIGGFMRAIEGLNGSLIVRDVPYSCKPILSCALGSSGWQNGRKLIGIKKSGESLKKK